MHRVSEISTQIVEAVNMGDAKADPNFEKQVKRGFRVLMVIIYCLVSVCYGIFGSAMTAYSKTASEVYKVNLDVINLTSSVWSVAGIISGIPANYLIGVLGIRKSLIVATVFYMIGMVVKNFINYNIYLVHVGQFIAGMGGPFCTYATANFAAHWYTGPMRGVIISVASLMAPFGVMLSFIAPFLFIDPSTPSEHQIRFQIQEYFTFNTALSVFLFLASVFFFHENPHSDSIGTDEDGEEQEEKIPAGKIVADLFTDIKYIFIMLAFGFANGALAGISAILSPVMAVWGLGEEFGGTCAAVGVSTGVVFSIFYAIFLMNKPGQIIAIQFFMAVAVLTGFGFIWCLHSKQTTLLIICTAINCSMAMTSIPVLLSEVSNRVGKQHLQLATGFMFFLGNGGSAFAVWFLGKLINDLTKPSTQVSFYAAISVYGAGLLSAILAGVLGTKKFAGAGKDGEGTSDQEEASLDESDFYSNLKEGEYANSSGVDTDLSQ